MQNYSLFDIIGPPHGGASAPTRRARKACHMARKIARGDVKEAELTPMAPCDDRARHGTDKALVARVLGLAPDDARLRFSLLLAQEAGVAVTINFSEEEPDHPNTARIRLTGTDGKVTEVVGASIGGGNIRITEINGMAVEFSGEYPTLIVRHTDVPGVINDVTSILARERINVAFMRVFRQARRADACMVIETDTPVPERTRQLILDWCPETTEVFTI